MPRILLRSLSGTLLALLFAGPSTLHGEEPGEQPAPAGQAMETVIWSGIFLGSASPSTQGREVPAGPSSNLVERMRRAESLRFEHYRLLGEHSQNLLKDYETWLVPARDVFFKLDLRGTEPDGGLRLALQLWRGQEILIKTDVLLIPGRPLLIRGPESGSGHLILALEIRD